MSLSSEAGDEGGVSRCVVCGEELELEGEEEARAIDSMHERAPFVGVFNDLIDLSPSLQLLSSTVDACFPRVDAFSPSSSSVLLLPGPSFRFLLIALPKMSLPYVAVPFLLKAPFPEYCTCDLEILPKAWMFR